MLEKNVANLVQDIDSMQGVFLAIKGDPSSALSRVLSYLSSFEDQALKAKKIQRNLSNHEALMAQDSSNKQEAKELMRLIDDLKNSSSRTDPELSQLEIKRAKLEKELESVKAAIDRRKFTLAQIPDAVKQKKQELLAKVKRSRAIRSSLENTPGTAKEYEQKIAEVDVVWLELLKIIQDVLNL